ncbi:MAG TPA: FAD-binding oxidoreductase [Acidimicrobiales bacterium]|nr:FAD-binding oxidoreductase [Acidimicrobiales bacterium]
MRAAEVADAVVIGGGTVGAWCAWFLKRAGLERVCLVERTLLGRGASSRAAGMVRAQGGTPWAVRLGMWSRDFYRTQHEAIGVDSGFVAQGYLMPAFSAAEVEAGRARVAMQAAEGLDVSWLSVDEADHLVPAMAPGRHLGGSYAPGDGYIDPPRNVAAYTAACLRDGVDVREGAEFLGLATTDDGRLRAVETSDGPVATERVVLTGGPELADVGRRAGTRVHAGGARHQVAVTEPDPRLAPDRVRMAFDLAGGIYWRPEDGGLLFGMSNPDEPPGPARDVDWAYLDKVKRRLAELLPATDGLGLRRVWAATIDYTPDHLPILGPALDTDGAAMAGVTVASAGGHGMMWGPAVARVAADLALEGSSPVLDVASLGLDRFDREGRSRLTPDPIALPFPERTTPQ